METDLNSIKGDMPKTALDDISLQSKFAFHRERN